VTAQLRVPAVDPPGSTLRDPDLDRDLRELGSTVIDVPDGVVEQLAELYAATRPAQMPGFLATTQTDDPPLKRRVHDEVCRLAQPIVEASFVAHRSFAGNFVVKQPGDVWVEPHQDLNFVDERAHRAVVLWLPLHDVAVADGAIHVVPGSHRLPTLPRGSGEHRYPFAPVGPHLKANRSVPVPLRRGQALVYDSRTLHWSGPNQGSHERVAAAFAVVPAAAPLHHYHLNPDGTVAVIEVDDQIYADTRFHGFPVRGTVLRVEDLPELGAYDEEGVDALLEAAPAGELGSAR
jgi:hypothetical protein